MSKTLSDALPRFADRPFPGTDERLRVADLTEAAFGELYRLNVRALWTYVYRVIGNAADADDIVQDAFCRLLRANVGGLSDDERRRYVFRIAGNLIADRWRRSSREQSRRAIAGDPVAAEPPSQRDGDVTRTFAALKPRERALLWLAYVEGENHQTIAESLGLARGSIKVLLSRARAKLRDLLVSKGLGRAQ